MGVVSWAQMEQVSGLAHPPGSMEGVRCWICCAVLILEQGGFCMPWWCSLCPHMQLPCKHKTHTELKPTDQYTASSCPSVLWIRCRQATAPYSAWGQRLDATCSRDWSITAAANGTLTLARQQHQHG